ncbi:MAG: DUF3750 domain-containing protein [Betaproteobacteria bacterium]|nr:DUF3750 domain-containing protein [Betaproteobacteria bacterium]
MACFLFAGLMLVVAVVGRSVIAQDWRNASHEPVGLAPDPAATPEAVVQVYAARTWGMRGLFGVHTWVAVKPAGARAYTVYEVIGWRLRWAGSALAIHRREPDARWFGNAPELLADQRGAEAAKLIPRIDAAARAYPYADEYTVWPGPNSNTFTAWIARAVPELEVDFPATAIGKDYRESLFGAAPSGSGGQFSLGGLFALTASGVEGLEVNILGLTFGINPFDPALKLPLVGRLGASRLPVQK